MQTDASVPTLTSTERIAVVDALRAFALLGIIITHAALGFLAGPVPVEHFNSYSALDRVVDDLVRVLTFGKFFAIFSFLFGLSFAIQLENATRKGASFSGRFTWRLMILLAIGFVHSLFFSGDILVIYGLLGLLLIPFRKLKNRTLLIVSLILILNVPGVLLSVLTASAPAPSAEQQQANLEFQAQFTEMAVRQFDIKRSGSLSEVMHVNLTETPINKLFFLVLTGRLWITLGLFLLGLYAGRINLFRETDANRNLFRRMFVWAGGTALITSIIEALYPNPIFAQTFTDVLTGISFTIQQASLTAFYIAAVTLVFWSRPSHGLLPPLAATGRMGLTTYLMQTAFGLIVFYGVGFGLLDQLGVAASVGLSILFFAVQILFASWWMSHFKLGPVEWLWRSLTYFKLQPNGRAAAARLY